MIDEKKLIDDLIHNDGIKFDVRFDVSSPEALGNSVQQLVDKLKDGVVNLINAQPKVGSGWIPVYERLPEPFELVYVYVPTEQRVTDAYLTRHKEWVGVRMNREVTHWMPMPEPPKAGGGL